MNIYNSETLGIEMTDIGYFFKAIANKNAIAFFSKSIQHRDLKIGGLSYEDDYLGNALACIIKPKSIEIRFHSEYSDLEVTHIFRTILSHSEAKEIKDFKVSYQGRSIL